MPRSGGDYVWTGRILHPALGTSLNLTWVVYDALFMGSLANYMISYAVYSVFVSTGVITQNFGLIDWAQSIFTNPFWIAVLGTLLLVYATILMIRGVTQYLKQQLVLWIIGMIGTIVAIVLLLGATPAQYAVAFDSAMSHYTTYQSIIDSAKSTGFTWAPSLSATFAAMAFAYLVNIGYQFSGYFAGELKRVQKSMLTSTMGNNILSTFFYALFAWAFVRAVGDNWLHSLSYLAYAQPSAYKIPIIPNPFFLATLLTNNLTVASIINIALIAWGIMIIPSNWLAYSRVILAMGFDRVLPTKMADVSDRFHTPVVAILFIALISWLGLIASLYYGIIFANMNFTLVYTIALAIGGLTGALFPFVRKPMYEKSPIARYKIGGLPLITIVGVITFFFFTYLAYAAGLNPAVGGPTTPYALTTALLAFILAGALYYASRAYHKAKDGIDISLAFREVPPE
jgi:amino acid transporter